MATNRSRVHRLAGGSTGTLFAILIAWGVRARFGKDMPGEVAAALGGVMTTFLICLDEFRAFLWILIDRIAHKKE